jgi:signal transduction histidine kinase/ActR/RegA family two-component response regulator
MSREKFRRSTDLETGSTGPGNHAALSNVELATALWHVPSNLMILSPELRVVWINEIMAETFALDPVRSVGEHWYDLAPFMRRRDAYYQRAIHGESFDFPCVDIPFPDGGRRYFEVHYRPIQNDPEELASVFVVAHEITESKQTDDLLHEKRIRLELLNELLQRIGANFTADEVLRHTVSKINEHLPAYRVSVGVIDKEGLLSFKHSAEPNEMPSILGLEVDLTAGPEHLAALRSREKIVVSDVERDPRLAPFVDTLHDGKTRAILDVPLFHSQNLVGVLCLHAPVAHEWTDGEIGMLSEISEYVSIAIREARNAEVRNRLERHLRQKQKLEALGSLAGGISHDFNNILQAISLNTAVVKETGELGDASQRKLEETAAMVQRGKDLVEQILVFSRWDEVTLAPLPIQAAVEGAVRLMRATLPATIEIRKMVDGVGGCILGDRTQIEQVVVNLCANASHAMKNSGVLEVSLAEVGVKVDDESFPELDPGRYARLNVSDTGVGMPPSVKARALEPFFTTKAVGEGSGMGLAVVHGIVDSHGGAIRIESVENEGTSVEVLLPLCEATGEPVAVEERTTAYGEGSILFVDDEEPILSSGKLLLELRGFRVTVATDGNEALELFRSDPAAFDVVVTDETMPGMTGLKLAEEILRIRPDIPVILVTGFSETATPAETQAVGVHTVLMKPMEIDKVAEVVRDATRNR